MHTEKKYIILILMLNASNFNENQWIKFYELTPCLTNYTTTTRDELS
jgi:hypothetical protein